MNNDLISRKALKEDLRKRIKLLKQTRIDFPNEDIFEIVLQLIDNAPTLNFISENYVAELENHNKELTKLLEIYIKELTKIIEKNYPIN